MNAHINLSIIYMEMFSETASEKTETDSKPTNYAYLKQQLKLHKHLRKKIAEKAQTLPLSWRLKAKTPCAISLSVYLIYLQGTFRDYIVRINKLKPTW